MEQDTQAVLVGRIGGPYGVRGWVRIHSFTEPQDNLFDYAPWALFDAAGKVERSGHKLLEHKAHGNGWVARFADIDDRDLAESLKGSTIWVNRSQLPELQGGQYYWADLEGLRVENRDGRQLGHVDHMLDTGSADVMVIVGDTPAERWLVPFVQGEIVLEVDLNRGLIQVDWEGLSDGN